MIKTERKKTNSEEEADEDKKGEQIDRKGRNINHKVTVKKTCTRQLIINK